MIQSNPTVDLQREQEIQEQQYVFPYHYLPNYDRGRYKQMKSLRWGYQYLSYLQFVRDEVLKIDFQSMIDFGCGDGRLLRDLNRAAPGKDLVGIDYSERAVGLARALSPDVEYRCCDIYDDTQMARRFDVGTAIETLEHIPPDDLPRFVRGMRNRIGDDGHLIVTVPSKNVPVSKKHYQHFDAASITSALSPYFQIETVEFLNKRSFIGDTLIKKLFHNRLFILNQGATLGALFRIYCRRYLNAAEHNGARVFVHARPSTESIH
ncbi:bifunctional 3-demethylubiquinone-9 3-methyltransferase/ 2-octaprenyl-6-hydroxy phenol methylase [Stieleria neptunia]|uniref:Bifunctional 3-demethylubiquinone-9 3-methyltransferase/ 2-octaprenyl-6-hydroxy phenol methylase n=1 Tax=Stieleria neptunia TaxID=2527979 RepID=A0A518HN70_9BACT|nr:class I SAM-dependent methyltransferase [Stieleria neptunia]QDV42305.1 bifunctional 3-demethylubiquinone-9 3-methyltransferase/ 2-octaprenyl-6-hydroxy phenol methylase [Stieleria neptunia]